MKTRKIIPVVFFTFLLGFSSFAQSGDTITVAGIRFYPDMKIKVGRPSQDRPFFTYITASPTVGALDPGNQNGFGVDFAGRYFIIKRIEKKGTEQFGFKIYLVCKTPSPLRAWVDIENAILTKEIIISENPK